MRARLLLAALAAVSMVAAPVLAAPKAKAKAASAKGDAVKGKATYEMYCTTCHGKEGRGDGPSAAGLSVKPRNHTDDRVMSKLTDAQIIKTIRDGGKAVGKSELMPAWGAALADPDVRDVLAYVRTLHRKK